MADTTKTTSADALGLDAQAEMLKTERRANNVWNKLKRNKTAMIGLVIVVVMVFIAVFAPVLAPYDPDEIHPLDAFLKPFSEGHIFGTDQFGRDLLSRVIYGARVSLIVAAGGTFVGGIIGVLLGLIAVWKNRRKKISDKRKGTAEITRELSVSFTKVLHFLAQK